MLDPYGGQWCCCSARVVFLVASLADGAADGLVVAGGAGDAHNSRLGWCLLWPWPLGRLMLMMLGLRRFVFRLMLKMFVMLRLWWLVVRLMPTMLIL